MPLFDRIQSWMEVEPAIALPMLIAALVIFVTSFVRSQDASSTLWSWIKRVIESALVVLLFLGLLWAFRSILNSNRTTFNSTHGSLSDANLQSAYTIWGRPHTQLELGINHYVWKTIQEEIPQKDPEATPRYRDVQVRESIPQDSILGFKGDVMMTLDQREKGYGYYSGFKAEATFEYQVVNNSDVETEVDFSFPLSPGQTMFDGFQITEDGKDIRDDLHFTGDNVFWMHKMKPHQEKTIVIAYKTRGMEYFYYQIPIQREIKNFSLVITVDKLPTTLLNYPMGCLTPTDVKPTADRQGSILTWSFDRTITTAGMGIALPQPEQPGAQVLRVLHKSPYALTLLIAILALTLLILGQPVHFLDMALLAAVYCLQFLVMAGLSDYRLGFWGSLILGAGLTSLLAFLLYRRHSSKLLRGLIAGLVLFFAVVYPLSGLLVDVINRNSFDAIVQVGMIIYLFFLSLYSRLQDKQTRSAIPPAGAI